MATKRESLCPVSNAPSADELEDTGFPDKYALAIRRANRRIEELECIVRDKNERLAVALAMLNDELLFWRMFLHDHVGETMDGILKRVGRIESTISRMVEKGTRYYPPLPIPEQWLADRKAREKSKR